MPTTVRVYLIEAVSNMWEAAGGKVDIISRRLWRGLRIPGSTMDRASRASPRASILD